MEEKTTKPKKKWAGNRIDKRNRCDVEDLERKVYYAFITKPCSNYPNPTFIFAYAEMRWTTWIFDLMVAKLQPYGIAKDYKITKELILPIRYSSNTHRIEVELIDYNPDFMSFPSLVLLLDHLLKKYGKATEVERCSLSKVINL